MHALSTDELARVIGGAGRSKIAERKPQEINPAALCGENGLDYQTTIRDKEGRTVWEETVCKK